MSVTLCVGEEDFAVVTPHVPLVVQFPKLDSKLSKNGRLAPRADAVTANKPNRERAEELRERREAVAAILLMAGRQS